MSDDGRIHVSPGDVLVIENVGADKLDVARQVAHALTVLGIKAAVYPGAAPVRDQADGEGA